MANCTGSSKCTWPDSTATTLAYPHLEKMAMEFELPAPADGKSRQP